MDHEVENELIEVAMKIILHAGDARIKIEEALDYAKAFEFNLAEETLIKAGEDIRLAHVTQTNIIQNEMSGQKYEINLLFNHAQDTLMTVMSELRLTKSMVELYKLVSSNLTQ